MKFHLININGHIVFVFKNKKFKRKSVATFNKIKCVLSRDNKDHGVVNVTR